MIHRLGFFMVFFCALSIPALADADKRPSTASLFLSGGEGGSTGAYLTGNFGIDSVWSLTGSLSSSRFEELRSSEARACAEAQTGPGVLLRFGLTTRREAEDLTAAGLGARIIWTASRLWGASLNTDVQLDAEWFGYNYEPDPAGDFVQRMILLGITQQLAQSVSIGAGFANYRYGRDLDEINQAVRSRAAAFPGIEGWVAGFPADVFTLTFAWRIIDPLELAIAGSRSTQVPDGISQDLEVRNGVASVSYDFNERWTGTIEGSSSAIGEDRLQQLGLGASYRF